MADNKDGREKQAANEDRRQRERDVAAELERGDEPEPPVDVDGLVDLESALTSLEFPVTGAAVVDAIGDHDVDSVTGSYALEELVPETDEEVFDSPAAVTAQLLRPTVAAAMKRVLEASDTLPNTDFPWSQRKAYELTLQELKAIDADDEGVTVIADWIVEHVREKKGLPSSRDVRRRAMKLCRANGYQVRSDGWLGI